MPHLLINKAGRPPEVMEQVSAHGIPLTGLSAAGIQRLKESETGGVRNPLTDPLAKQALAVIDSLETAHESGKREYLENRSSLRAICDALLGTGKENQILDIREVSQVFEQRGFAAGPKRLLDSLWGAGLIELFNVLPDSESGAGMISGHRIAVKLTERGKTLLSVKRQPSLLLVPEN